MRMEEIYPATMQRDGHAKGWVVFGNWGGSLIKPMDDDIAQKYGATIASANDAESQARRSPVRCPRRSPKPHERFPRDLTDSDDDSDLRSFDLRLAVTQPAVAIAKKAGAESQVGFRLMSAMGVASDGSLESTLAELSSQMEDLQAEQERQSGLAKMRAELAQSHALRERKLWEGELAVERVRGDLYGSALEKASEQIEGLEERIFKLEMLTENKGLEAMEKNLEVVILQRESERLAVLADKPRRDAEAARYVHVQLSSHHGRGPLPQTLGIGRGLAT